MVNGAANTVAIGATDKIELTGVEEHGHVEAGARPASGPRSLNLGNHNAVGRAK